MSSSPKRLIVKGVILIVLIVIGVILLTRIVSQLHERDARRAASAAQTARPTPSFSRMICTDAYDAERHYEKANPPYIEVVLHDGCFPGYIGLPDKWTTWQYQMQGTDPADWISLWYGGWPNPAGPYSGNQMNSGAIHFDNVPTKQVRLEGKGTVRIYRVTGDMHNTPVAGASGEEPPPTPLRDPLPGAVPAPAEEKPFTPIMPTSGLSTDYDLYLAECKRVSETITCRAFFNNKTDAPALIWLHGGKLTDDEGNVVEIDQFGFGNTGVEKLAPGVKTRTTITARDGHAKVKTVTLSLNFQYGNTNRTVLFKDVPVQ